MTRTFLVFGDSNSHGTKPIISLGETRRYAPETRWPNVAATALGPDWAPVVEGLPGRTTQFDDPVRGASMNGQIGLRIALGSHGPIDLLVLMLGTNDAKTRFAPTPARITAGIAGLVEIAMSPEVQDRHGGFGILVICPPPVIEVGPIVNEFIGAAAPSRALPPVLEAYCAARGIGFFDAGTVIACSPQDGVHFEPEAHHALGLAVAAAIRAL